MPSSISMNAPKSVRLRTRPSTLAPTGYFSISESHGFAASCRIPSEIRRSVGFTFSTTHSTWLDAEHRYPVGAHVNGRVISVTDYGAFVELEQGIEGLVHVSEMTWSKRAKHPSKLVGVNDQVECVVLNVNPTERRISLGMRQLAANPWDSLIEKYPVGATVEGRVRNLTDFGAFIEIEEGIDGLVHVSNLS